MTPATEPAVSAAGLRPVSVALVCDFREENWRSMDIVADAVAAEFQNNAVEGIRATALRPQFKRLASGLTGTGTAFKADRLINRFGVYPWWLRKRAGEFDVYHILDHSYAQLVHELPAHRTVVTCHDVDTFRCLVDPSAERRSPFFRAMTQRIAKGFRNSARVLCVSEATRRQVLAASLADPARVSVITNGISDTFSAETHPAADEQLQNILRGDSRAPYLLHVGSTIPRKRIDVLLRVFAAMRKRFSDMRLVRVGAAFTPEQTSLAESLGLSNAICTLPFVDTQVLAAAYRRATLCMLTSESEGFGLPAAEAMACGCPLVLSDIPAFREVAGDAVQFCPANDVDAWVRQGSALWSTLTGTPESRSRIAAEGISRAARFRWHRVAEQLASVYTEIATQSSVIPV